MRPEMFCHVQEGLLVCEVGGCGCVIFVIAPYIDSLMGLDLTCRATIDSDLAVQCMVVG